MLRIETQRFGLVVRPKDSVIHFSSGIFGFELQRNWLLLADSEHGSLYWLQSTDQADLSLAVVDPREFLPDYQLKIAPAQLSHFKHGNVPLTVLTMLSHYADSLTINLRNPVLISSQLRLGRQVVASGESPMRYELSAKSTELRRSA